jgi:hypothetical protein
VKILVYKSNSSKVGADLFYRFRYSKVSDFLYRNKYVQRSRLSFMYYSRKYSFFMGVRKALYALLKTGEGTK